LGMSRRLLSRTARGLCTAVWSLMLFVVLLPPLHAATSFQFAYMSGTSGPASGGTAVNVVGNQFQAGATGAIGGKPVSAAAPSPTRIGATTSPLSAGALYDVSVTNPGGPTSLIARAWFADYL